jgi:hypothetical protein
MNPCAGTRGGHPPLPIRTLIIGVSLRASPRRPPAAEMSTIHSIQSQSRKVSASRRPAKPAKKAVVPVVAVASAAPSESVPGATELSSVLQQLGETKKVDVHLVEDAIGKVNALTATAFAALEVWRSSHGLSGRPEPLHDHPAFYFHRELMHLFNASWLTRSVTTASTRRFSQSSPGYAPSLRGAWTILTRRYALNIALFQC